MAGSILSSLSNLARPNVASGPVDLQFRKTDLFNLLRDAGRIVAGDGPAPFKWNVVTATNSSVEVFTEGAPPPDAGRQTTAQASLEVFAVRGVIGLTGHVRDNMAKANAFYDDPFSLEQVLATADVIKKVEDELVGSTQDRGIAAIIDSTGTYAGLAQGTYAAWASEENGSISTLGIDDLEDLWEELVSGSVGGVPRGAMPTHVLMPPNQITNYKRTIGPSASSGGTFRSSAESRDFGLKGPMEFQGMPIVAVRGMTTTESYMVDITDMELVEHRGLRINEIVGNPEEEKYQLSLSLCLKVKHRNWHGKLTGITA